MASEASARNSARGRRKRRGPCGHADARPSEHAATRRTRAFALVLASRCQPRPGKRRRGVPTPRDVESPPSDEVYARGRPLRVAVLPHGLALAAAAHLRDLERADLAFSARVPLVQILEGVLDRRAVVRRAVAEPKLEGRIALRELGHLIRG